jgi:hypothetical protein
MLLMPCLVDKLLLVLLLLLLFLLLLLPRYLSNVATTLCLNVDDCGEEIIAFTCVTSGGTCCGATCYDGLVFALQADGSLSSPSQPGQCVTFQVGSCLVRVACCCVVRFGPGSPLVWPLCQDMRGPTAHQMLGGGVECKWREERRSRVLLVALVAARVVSGLWCLLLCPLLAHPSCFCANSLLDLLHIVVVTVPDPGGCVHCSVCVVSINTVCALPIVKPCVCVCECLTHCLSRACPGPQPACDPRAVRQRQRVPDPGLGPLQAHPVRLHVQRPAVPDGGVGPSRVVHHRPPPG